MAACTPTPTRTLYQTLISSSPSTGFSTSITTIPAVLTTITFESCQSSVADANATVCVQSTEVSTIQGVQTNTVQLPFTLETQVTQTIPTNTVFQSCPSTSSLKSSTSSSPPSHGSFVSSSVLVLSTPPPSTAVIQSSTTLANGQVSVVNTTVLYTQSATAVYVPTTGLVQETQGSGGTPAQFKAIIGGSVGGVVGLSLIIAALWWIRKRRHKFEELYEKTTSNDDLRDPSLQRSRDRKRFDIDSDLQSKPYHYGLVGHGGSPISTYTDDASPIPPALGFSTATSVPSMVFSESTQSHSRRASASIGSLAPFLNSDHMIASSLTTAVSSEERHGLPSPPPHITMSFGNWPEDEENSVGRAL